MGRLWFLGGVIVALTLLAGGLALAAAFVGGDGPDKIVGTNRADSLLGRGGGDTINGRGGDDEVLGEDGSDTISGGFGDDQVFGYEGLYSVSSLGRVRSEERLASAHGDSRGQRVRGP